MATLTTESVLAGVCPDRTNGQVQVSWGHYSYADEGAAVSGDVIQMCNVPAGARIIDIMVEWTALGAATTIDVGDGDDDDRFQAAIDCNTASGRLSLFGGFSNGAEIDEAINESGLGYTYDDADTIDVTLNAGLTETGDTITLCVLYTVEGGFSDE